MILFRFEFDYFLKYDFNIPNELRKRRGQNFKVLITCAQSILNDLLQ